MFHCTNKSNNVFQLQIIRLIVCCDTKKCKQIFFWFDVCFACDHMIISKIDSHFLLIWILNVLYTFFLTSKFLEMIFFHMFCIEIREFVCLYVDVSIWKNIVIVIFATNSLIWKIIVIVIFASNIFRNSQSICVKNLKKHFFEWFKKNMIWWFYCLLFSISKIWFRTIHNFRYDDWQLTCWQRNRNRILFEYFIFLFSYIRIDILLQNC